MSHILNFISRVCMSAVFIVYGWTKLLHPETVANLGATKRLFAVVASGAAAPVWFGYLIGAIEFFGGIAIILGIKTRLVAWLFVIYLIAVTYFGHPFWATGEAADKGNFYKNLAIIGAFLMLALQGGGAHSVDGRMSASREEI
jgi:putative oxidoreductase